MALDVVTLGETMLRFTPPGNNRFAQSPCVEMHVGGSESNTAVALSRLGHRVAWISRLPSSPLGSVVVDAIRQHGVDTSLVRFSPDDRLGIYYMERGEPPRDSSILYDRAGSAMSRMTPNELPSDLFRPELAKIFHTTGITLGISASARDTAMLAVQRSRDCGWQISFDLNYRARLWPAEEAFIACEPIMRQADFLFLPQRDASGVCGISEVEPRGILAQLHARYPHATITLTLGHEGAATVDSRGDFYMQPSFAATLVERLGSGDAFTAGFLSAQLEGCNLSTTLRWANATAAIKRTIPGDLPLIDREHVEALVAGRGASGIHR